jgi:hypothetical protein
VSINAQYIIIKITILKHVSIGECVLKKEIRDHLIMPILLSKRQLPNKQNKKSDCGIHNLVHVKEMYQVAVFVINSR